MKPLFALLLLGLSACGPKHAPLCAQALKQSEQVGSCGPGDCLILADGGVNPACSGP